MHGSEPGHMDLEFTGERLVPDKVSANDDIFIEHLTRYIFSRDYVRNKIVLDAGCGCGYGLNLLAPMISEGVGVDISKGAIAYSQSNFNSPNVKYSVMDCCQLTFPDQYFNAVVSFEFIEHIEDHDTFLRGITRVLDQDGIFIVSTPNKNKYIMAGKNPFHLNELYLEEFKMSLERYFKKVNIVGQRLHPEFVASKQINELRKEVAWFKLQKEHLRATFVSLGKSMLPGFVWESLRNKRRKDKLLNIDEKSLMEKIVISSSDLVEAVYFIGVCEGKR